MKRFFVTILAFAFACIFFTATAYAVVIFQDDFNSDAGWTGTSDDPPTYPTSYDYYPVIGAGDAGGSWKVYNTNGSPANVFVEAYDGAQYLQIRRTDDWLSGAAKADLGVIVAKPITVSFDFANYAATGYRSWVSGWTEIDPTNGIYNNRTFDIYFDNTTDTVLYYDGTFKDTEIPFGIEAGTVGFDHVIIDYYPETGTFDLDVNGITATGLTTAAGAGAPLGEVFFGCDIWSTTWLVDNVEVSTEAIPGDTDLDGDVDDADAATMADNWLGSGGWLQGDFTGDGTVDEQDAALLAANWTVSGGGAAVPEPSTLVLLLGIGMVFVWQRRR